MIVSHYFRTMAGEASSDNTSMGMKIVTATLRKQFGNVQHLSTEKLAELLEPSNKGDNSQHNVLLLDSRGEEEFTVSHLPGAVRVDPNIEDVSSVLNLLLDNVSPTNATTVVCYCSLGYRSSSLAQKIQHFVRSKPDSNVNVYNLEGSIFKWANEGRAMVDLTNTPTIYAHPYNIIWGRLLNKELRREKTP